jgi:hypothetical protein
VAARQRRGRDRVHPCTAVSARRSVRKRCGEMPYMWAARSRRDLQPLALRLGPGLKQRLADAAQKRRSPPWKKGMEAHRSGRENTETTLVGGGGWGMRSIQGLRRRTGRGRSSFTESLRASALSTSWLRRPHQALHQPRTSRPRRSARRSSVCPLAVSMRKS